MFLFTLSLQYLIPIKVTVCFTEYMHMCAQCFSYFNPTTHNHSFIYLGEKGEASSPQTVQIHPKGWVMQTPKQHWGSNQTLIHCSLWCFCVPDNFILITSNTFSGSMIKTGCFKMLFSIHASCWRKHIPSRTQTSIRVSKGMPLHNPSPQPASSQIKNPA